MFEDDYFLWFMVISVVLWIFFIETYRDGA